MSWHPQLPSVGVMDLAVFAGVLSTGLFAMSYLPMLVKASRTRDLSSYSFGNLATTNAGNALYSVYVFSLPAGPIWFLHTFYLAASALMLVWFLRYHAARPESTDDCGIRGVRPGAAIINAKIGREMPSWIRWTATGSTSMVQPSTSSELEFTGVSSSRATRAMTRPVGSTTR